MQTQTVGLIAGIAVILIVCAILINWYNEQNNYLRSQYFQYQDAYYYEKSANEEIVDCFNENKGNYVYHTPCLLGYN